MDEVDLEMDMVMEAMAVEVEGAMEAVEHIGAIRALRMRSQ